jgi:hypothetical protein
MKQSAMVTRKRRFSKESNQKNKQHSIDKAIAIKQHVDIQLALSNRRIILQVSSPPTADECVVEKKPTLCDTAPKSELITPNCSAFTASYRAAPPLYPPSLCPIARIRFVTESVKNRCKRRIRFS